MLPIGSETLISISRIKTSSARLIKKWMRCQFPGACSLLWIGKVFCIQDEFSFSCRVLPVMALPLRALAGILSLLASQAMLLSGEEASKGKEGTNLHNGLKILATSKGELTAGGTVEVTIALENHNKIPIQTLIPPGEMCNVVWNLSFEPAIHEEMGGAFHDCRSELRQGRHDRTRQERRVYLRSEAQEREGLRGIQVRQIWMPQRTSQDSEGNEGAQIILSSRRQGCPMARWRIQNHPFFREALERGTEVCPCRDRGSLIFLVPPAWGRGRASDTRAVLGFSLSLA